MLSRLVVVPLALATLALGGCGGSDEKPDAPSSAGPAADGSAGASTGPSAAPVAGEQDAKPTGEVPDPCTLVDTEQLTDLLGSDPGEGTGAGTVPDQRKICTFSSGVILAVEVAEDWDRTLQQFEENVGKDALAPVPGVGEEAYWQEVGRQFIVLGQHYFVGVTGADQAAGQAVAEAMLAAL